MRISDFIVPVATGYHCLLCSEANSNSLRIIKYHIKNKHVQQCDNCQKEVIQPHICDKICALCMQIHSNLCGICSGNHCPSVCQLVGELISDEKCDYCQESHDISSCSKVGEVMDVDYSQKDDPIAGTSK